MPHLSPSTVQAVQELPIAEIIGRHVALKPKGAALWGCCPFHDEKTPSFEVRPAKNHYKCFGGCGSGDGIGFAMQLGKRTFVEAVEELAQQHGIPVVYDAKPLSPEQQKADEAHRKERQEVAAVLEWAADWFATQPVPGDYFTGRGLSANTVEQAGLGYAPAGGKALLDTANAAGYLAPVLIRASLLREVQVGGSTTYFDFFQERAMFPLRDSRGKCVAFTGRYIGPAVAADKYQPPKAINSDEKTWIKGAHLYGLNLAGDAIRKAGFAYLVEGQMDALQMAQHGLANTVAQGGTALTDEQIALLKRYTAKVVLVYDNDPAGRKAIRKNAPALLAAGFQVSVLVPADDADAGKTDSDPDSYLLGLRAVAEKLLTAKPRKGKKAPKVLDSDPLPDVEQQVAQLVAEWVRGAQDYITAYAVAEAMKDADLGMREKAQAITALGELLESLPNPVERQTYWEEVASLWPPFKKAYKLAKRKAEPALEVKKETKDALARLTAEQMTDSMEAGFFERHGGYWFYDTQKGREICICEFTIEFLFFVVSNNRPKYVVRLTNSFGRYRLVSFSTDDLVSKDAFNKAIGRLHGYVFEGSQHHLNRIKIKLWAGCREALEASTLGWNEKTQLYAWNNGLLRNGEFFPSDKYGVVTLRKPVAALEALEKLPHESQLEIDGTVPVLNTPAEILTAPGMSAELLTELIAANKVVELSYHYLPSSGSFSFGGDEADDLAVKFRHLGTGTLTFSEWAALICEVNGHDNGRTMVAFYVAALFRSIIHKANGGYFPILFHFGLMGSGKSQSCLNLMYMFGTPPHDDGLTLQSGSTTTAMQRILTGRADALVWLNEYKNTLPDSIIGTLKDLAGGSGKTVGVATSGNETRTMVPKSAAIISGEQLPTIAQSLMDRCIINEFDKRDQLKTQEAYQRLGDLQKAGETTAVTVELLAHRPLVQAGYKKLEPACTAELRAAGKALLGDEPNSRAVLNLTSVLTPCRLLMEAGVVFPFTYDELKTTLLAKLAISVSIQNVSNDVETYFLTLTGLNPQLCEEGTHYKIEKDGTGRVLLFVRTMDVQGPYQQALKAQGGAPMAIGALRSYLEKHRCYVETVKHTRFANRPNSTSAMVFDYQMLRELGIEFRMKYSIRQAPRTVAAEAEETEAPKIHINGNVPELVAEFIGTLALTEGNPKESYKPARFFAAFNADKENPLTAEAFTEALRLGERLSTPAGGDRVVTYDEKGKVYVVALAELPF